MGQYISRDTLIVEADEQEGIYMANFDMEIIRNYRKNEVWGDAFRRPFTYLKLTENFVKDPFNRNEVRREVKNV